MTATADRIVRFLGDPREFFVRAQDIASYEAGVGATWVIARFGAPERKIKINLAVAYAIEEVQM